MTQNPVFPDRPAGTASPLNSSRCAGGCTFGLFEQERQTLQFIAAIHAASDRTRLRNSVAVFWKPRSLAAASGSSPSLKQLVCRRII
jgi:hypothetical protein